MLCICLQGSAGFLTVTVIRAQDTRPKPGGPPREVVVGVLAERLREKALSFHIEVLCLGATCLGLNLERHACGSCLELFAGADHEYLMEIASAIRLCKETLQHGSSRSRAAVIDEL